MSIEYEIIRSKRKTISVTVDELGQVKVRAPLRASQKQIDAFVAQNKDWIISRAEKRHALAVRHPPIKGTEDELLPYLGGNISLRKAASARPRLDGKTLFITDGKDAAEQIKRWYKEQAKEILTAITQRVAAEYGFEYSCVKISSSKKRYGSCSEKNNINYSFRLIMFPPECIEYVVVHELCHTVHKNHSAGFWASVAQICPNYKALQRKMTEESALMNAI